MVSCDAACMYCETRWEMVGCVDMSWHVWALFGMIRLCLACLGLVGPVWVLAGLAWEKAGRKRAIRFG